MGSIVVDFRRGEPEVDLVLGRVGTITAVADVATYINAQVTTDGARKRVGRVGGAKKSATAFDGTFSLPHHSADGSTAEVAAESSKEFFAGKIGVVTLSLFQSRGHHFHGDKFETFSLEAADNVTNEASLHTIRLDSYVGKIV